VVAEVVTGTCEAVVVAEVAAVVPGAAVVVGMSVVVASVAEVEELTGLREVVLAVFDGAGAVLAARLMSGYTAPLLYAPPKSSRSRAQTMVPARPRVFANSSLARIDCSSS